MGSLPQQVEATAVAIAIAITFWWFCIVVRAFGELKAVGVSKVAARASDLVAYAPVASAVLIAAVEESRCTATAIAEELELGQHKE